MVDCSIAISKMSNLHTHTRQSTFKVSSELGINKPVKVNHFQYKNFKMMQVFGDRRV